MLVIIGGKRRNRALISPAMALHVSVHKRNDPTPVVRAVGKVKESVLVHINAEIWPADAVRIDILEQVNPRRHGEDVAMFFEDFVLRGKTSIPLPDPAD